MTPDPGRYEERYGLTKRVVWTLTVVITLVSVAALVPSSLALKLIALLPALFALPGVARLVSRTTAFRADIAGITLGADPADWPFRRVPAVFIPWADIERVILYRRPSRLSGEYQPYIAVQRREGAPVLPRGNTPALGCPVPGVATGATRPVTDWRLDRERLAAVVAMVAPGIPIVDAGTVPSLDAGTVPSLGVGEPGPELPAGNQAPDREPAD
jgi:hypothetical protein